MLLNKKYILVPFTNKSQIYLNLQNNTKMAATVIGSSAAHNVSCIKLPFEINNSRLISQLRMPQVGGMEAFSYALILSIAVVTLFFAVTFRDPLKFNLK